MIALEAATGRPILGFGDDGLVDLKRESWLNDSAVYTGNTGV